MPLGTIDGGRGEGSGVAAKLGGIEAADLPDLTLPASDFENSMTLLVGLRLPASYDWLTEDCGALFVRCIQRPRTPSTALKNPVEPAASVRERASRVESSCWSSFSSWMPSVSRSPMSDTTEGRSEHG